METLPALNKSVLVLILGRSASNLRAKIWLSILTSVLRNEIGRNDSHFVFILLGLGINVMRAYLNDSGSTPFAKDSLNISKIGRVFF